MNPYDDQKKWADVRVGLIAFLALFFLIAGVTLAGGDKGLLFGKPYAMKALMKDVGGLKKGAGVTMGGMTIGKVSDIGFAQSEEDLIEAVLLINAKHRNRVKEDSLPSVKTQGMLGDRYVEISMGSKDAATLAEGDPLVGAGASDFDAALRQTTTVLNETEKLLLAVNQKEGTLGKIFYDEKLYNTLTEVSDALKELLRDFKANPKRYVKLSLF